MARLVKSLPSEPFFDEDELADLSELYDLLNVFTAKEALTRVTEMKAACEYWRTEWRVRGLHEAVSSPTGP